MGDTNSIRLGDHAQAKQVAQGQNITQTIIEQQIVMQGARQSDARFSIPAPPQNFTGRAEEIETLVNTLTRGQGASITGVSGLGGIGKSALAAVVATLVAPQFPDARMWIAMNGTDKNPKAPSDAMREIIFAFDPDTGAALKDASDAQIAHAYRGILHGMRALLVLDNARDNAQVRPLLQANAAFLITARAHLTEGGLQPLHLGVMKPDEAERYLISLCPRLSPLPLGEGSGVRELCEVCGYLPLALKIAGSYLAARPPVRLENYLARLKQARLDLLREGREAEANVEAAFQQTYEQLSPPQQTLFGALSVFPTSFTLQAAAYVWGLDEILAEAALGELVRASFLEFETGDERLETGDWRRETRDERPETSDRYSLHDLLREFGERRQTDDNRQQTAKRHAEFYERVARAADALYLQGSENLRAGLDLFDAELPHIRAGQAWAAANMERNDDAARLCSAYPDAAVYVADLRLSAREQIRWLEQAVTAARKLGNRQSEGAHLGNLGLAYAALGDVRKAIEYYEQQLVITREIGDRRGEGNALGNLGNAYADLGDVRKAIEYYEQRIEIAREIGDRRGEGNALANLGQAYKKLGDMNKAKELWRAALAIFEAIEDPNVERVRKWLAE
jgi:tetratricopeptide (TPR) repeat protein